MNGFVESNMGSRWANPWLAVSRITSPLNISDRMAKSPTQKKLITSLPCILISSKWKGGRCDKDTYPPGIQYLAFSETKARRRDFNTSAHRRDGARSWEMLKKVSAFVN